LSLLEASYLTFRLQPYYNNYKKRLAKRSKLYFYDTAIVCHLLGIDSPDHLMIHSSRGAIFEGFVISELIKNAVASGTRASCYFWREHSGYEVDLLIEQGGHLKAVEIKSGMTLSEHYLKGLHHLQSVMQNENNLEPYIVYAGQDNQYLTKIPVISWKEINKIQA
jgi:predicted AAA+ superfamily ATPase